MSGTRVPVRLSCGAYLLPLTRGLSAIIDECDFDLGAAHLWKAGRGAGGLGFYAARRREAANGGGVVFLHREILGARAGDLVDHRDGDKLNNRRSNIRICDAAENARNRAINRNNRSGFKGVHFADGRYVAQIAVNKTRIYIGCFVTAFDAARAYNAHALRLHGDFARINDLGV